MALRCAAYLLLPFPSGRSWGLHAPGGFSSVSAATGRALAPSLRFRETDRARGAPADRFRAFLVVSCCC
jgi:hypothetical protein